MSVIRHAIAFASGGTKTCGDAGVASHKHTGFSGVYVLELSGPLPQSQFASVLATHRGTPLRYCVAFEHTSDVVKRIIVRDNAAGLLDAALDVVIFALDDAASGVAVEGVGSFVGSSGAEYATSSAWTSARTSAGLYPVTFATTLPPDESVLVASRRGTPDVFDLSIEHVAGDLIKRVGVVDETLAAVDSDFDLLALRIG